MLTEEERLIHVGWRNKLLLQRQILKLDFMEIPNNQGISAGVVHGNRHHQSLADAVAWWLHSQGLAWGAEQWHAGFRCDIVSGEWIIEIGNTEEARAIKHLNVTDGKFCVVPFQDGESLTMLVFERGTKWEKPKIEKALVRRPPSGLDMVLGEDRELKHCPFCNSNRVGIEMTNQPNVLDAEVVYHVSCYNCGSIGPHQDNESAAKEMWNTRPNEIDDSHRSLLEFFQD